MSEEKQATESPEQQFTIERIYVKDLSFESPMGADAFVVDKQPEISQDLSSDMKEIAENMYEAVLKLTITAKVDDKTAFLVEVQQAGLFVLKGIEKGNLAHVLNTVCLQILFPYAREAIDSTLIKATFPPLMLPPINFEALYVQAMEENAAKAH